MTPIQIDRAVSRATGESVGYIRRRGFRVADLVEVKYDPEPNDLPPRTVDWDELDAQRVSLFP